MCAYPKKLIKVESISYKKMFEVTVIILLQTSLFINSNIWIHKYYVKDIFPVLL